MIASRGPLMALRASAFLILLTTMSPAMGAPVAPPPDSGGLVESYNRDAVTAMTLFGRQLTQPAPSIYQLAFLE